MTNLTAGFLGYGKAVTKLSLNVCVKLSKNHQKESFKWNEIFTQFSNLILPLCYVKYSWPSVDFLCSRSGLTVKHIIQITLSWVNRWKNTRLSKLLSPSCSNFCTDTATWYKSHLWYKSKSCSASLVLSEVPIFPHWRVQRNFHGFQVLVTIESLQKTASPARQKCRREEHSKINHCPPPGSFKISLSPPSPPTPDILLTPVRDYLYRGGSKVT